MDEMTMVKDLGEALAPAPRSPDALRQRVLDATAAPGRPAPMRTRLRGRRLLLPAMATAAAVIVLVAIGVIVGRGGPVEPVDPNADTAGLLRAAAQTALNSPTLTPRPNQFVYVESVDSSVVTEYTEGWQGKVREKLRLTGSHQEARDRQAWWSVDGTRDGLVRLRPRGSAGNWEDLPLQAPQPAAYVNDLPTDTAGMRDYLYRNSHGANAPDQQAFITVGDLIQEAYLPPQALAAMFRAAAQIPGVRVVPRVTDAAGRPGIAVAREDSGLRQELIFDPKTYRYLGERSIVVGHFEGQPKGTVMYHSAVLSVAIVDQIGQHP
jgi:hypothetical protein